MTSQTLPLFAEQQRIRLTKKQRICEIPLTRNRVALVDEEDYERISAFKWRAWPKKSGTWYASRTARLGEDRPGKEVLMHRAILDAPADLHVDHIDGDGLNNRRSNLRLATNAQNQWNRGAQRNNTSGYKGVSWDKRSSRWGAQIVADGIHKHLGYFADKEAAAKAYAEAARKIHGEFARVTVSGGQEVSVYWSERRA